MGWETDMQNENADLFTVIGELVYDPTDDELYGAYTPEDEFLDELYENDHYDADFGWVDEFVDDVWIDTDDQFTDYETDSGSMWHEDLSDQEYDDWADRDAHMDYGWDE